MQAAASWLQVGLASAGLALFFVACLQDWATRSVPNPMPSAIALLGLGQRLLAGNLAPGLLASGVIFLLAACCWHRGWLGGADVKLLGAGGLLSAPDRAAGFVLATCLGGGALALFYLVLGRLVGSPGPRRPNGSLLSRVWRIERRRLRRRGPLPYATAIAFGAAVSIVGR